jgi:hypothetical protein
VTWEQRRLVRAALGGGALGVAIVAARLGDGAATASAPLVVEAAVCGAVAGGATARFYGAPGAAGAARALLGGLIGAALGLALFAAGASVWLKGAPRFEAEALVESYPAVALALAVALHALACAAERRRAAEDAEAS